MLRRLLIISLVLLLQQPAQGTTSKRPLKLSVAKSFCTYSNKAKKAAANLAHKLNTIHNSLKAAEKASLQHQLGQAALPQYKEAAATLTIYAQAAYTEALAELQNWANEQTKTAGQAMYVAGRIDGLMEVLEGHMSTTKTNNKGCIANDGDATGIDKFVANTCGPQDTTTLTAEPIDLQGALTQDIPEETDPETLGGADHCLINDNPHSKYTAVTTPINLLDGTLKIPASGGFQTTTNVRHATLQSKLFKELKDKGAQLAQPLTATAQQIPTDYSALKNLLKDSSSREALKPAVAQYQNKAAGDTSITDDTIKAIFGLTKDNSEDGYLAAIKNLERPVPTTAGKSAPTNLFAMTCTQLEAALTVEISGIYEKSVELNKEIETLRQNQGKQASEQACNNIKIEADCNATAACSFNKTETDSNKKCQYDAQKATTNEVSVTQHQTGGTLTVNCSGHNNRPDSSEKKIL
uniref:Variant surface glycoprotein n=1 Tax=Trypanosoma brucei TaxID=5691 RepID=A0A1V0FY00_9TRYP|nr:variant surface glycoprotein [Trypanosoma brucei]